MDWPITGGAYKRERLKPEFYGSSNTPIFVDCRDLVTSPPAPSFPPVDNLSSQRKKKYSSSLLRTCEPLPHTKLSLSAYFLHTQNIVQLDKRRK